MASGSSGSDGHRLEARDVSVGELTVSASRERTQAEQLLSISIRRDETVTTCWRRQMGHGRWEGLRSRGVGLTVVRQGHGSMLGGERFIPVKKRFVS